MNMRERIHYDLASGMAEIMYTVFEANHPDGEANLDAMMMRLKDLSAYSLTHAEIMDQREGVELLALGMFFGMTSNPTLRYRNQSRLMQLSDEALSYQGQSEIIEEQVAQRKKEQASQIKNKGPDFIQRKLL
jgi:transaldolase